MQVIDRVEVHVLLVPAEHCFPGANVDIRSSDAIYFGIGQALAIKLDFNFGEIGYLRTVCISERFHSTPTSNMDPRVSAP